MKNFEKLGAFYLGRNVDPSDRSVGEELILYDAKDLTTHAVCVGMTGSGKTGLCVTLLEEAAIDGIPALVIDPKGDIGNLLLTFPDLDAASFKPWIDPSEATNRGVSVDEHAENVAALWKNGLAQWGQDGARVQRLRDAADVVIYTPGSSAGMEISALRSFAAPASDAKGDADLLRERLSSAASSLLALLGIEADPIRSREHILISSILQHRWEQLQDVPIVDLIRDIQKPPFERVGVLDLESFYPTKDRSDLAMRLNGLLASPSFAGWMQGEPLDIQRLLWTPQGKPKISVLSIAHLSDEERMFFVTLLLSETLAWMRSQPGTSSLRALLYMDEVFGFFPPTANPPSKVPMLTLLKQARAFGLGVVLATQNPVDLDYKGLSNAGTWFIGRLQTERDVSRVIEGLEGASTAAGHGFDRQETEATIAGLGSRVFLMNNVHEDAPVLFHTRWAMSYLRGPLTREQIKTLTAPLKAARSSSGSRANGTATATTAAATTAAAATSRAAQPSKDPPTPRGDAASSRPVLTAPLDESFLSVDGKIPDAGSGVQLVYQPALIGSAKLHFARASFDLDEWKEVIVFSPLDAHASRAWEDIVELVELPDEDAEPIDAGSYAELPKAVRGKQAVTRLKKALVSALYQQHAMTLWSCSRPKLRSRPGETEGDFRVRVREAVREARDAQLEKLRKRYTPKLKRLQERIRKAEARVEREESQYDQKKLDTVVSIGATILGALFGRKSTRGTVGRAATSAKTVGRAAKERGDIARAREALEALQQQLDELEAEFEEELEGLKDQDPMAEVEVTDVQLRPKKSDIQITSLRFAWTPWRLDPAGASTPAYRLEPREQ